MWLLIDINRGFGVFLDNYGRVWRTNSQTMIRDELIYVNYKIKVDY